MNAITLPLANVHCMSCVNKIRSALATLPDCQIIDIDTKQITVNSESPLKTLSEKINALGYQVGFHYQLALAGLSCGRCVAKVEAALASRNDIFSSSITKETADITGSISKQTLTDIITSLGYQVIPASSKLEENTLIFTLSGLSCGKCVAKLAEKLKANDQIQILALDKTHAELKTILAAKDIISIITEAGYQATQTTLDERLAQPASINEQESKDDKALNTLPSSESSLVQQLLLSGMTCASCVASVEKAIRQVTGVDTVSVNLAERTALISGTPDIKAVIAAITEAGYGAEISEDEQTRRHRQQQQNTLTFKTHLRNAFIALGLGVPMMAWGIFGGSMMIDSTISQLAWGFVGLITLLLLVTVGKDFYINSWKAFKHHRATMDTLVALGTGAAWLFSMLVVLKPDMFPASARHVYFEATAMIIGLITLGHALEARARSQTSKALERLIDLQPQTAIVVENGIESERPLNEIESGMTLRLRPGAKVAVDGVVIEGNTYIDESMLTGEPLAVHKQNGDKVRAGTINQQGSLLFKAEHIGSDTMLARIIQLVRQAQSSKPALARLADTISSIFVPSVMIIAIITAMVWYYFGPAPSSVYMLVAATTVLIIACPCALGLATPMSVTVGVGRAAELGILIRDAEAMQQAANINTVVLDKTGTLTEGKPQVVSIQSYTALTEDKLLQLTASLEQGSEHPLANAIIESAKQKDLTFSRVTEFKAVAGMGVTGTIDTNKVMLGNEKLMVQHNVDISQAHADFDNIASQGATPIYLAQHNQLIGIIGISDPLRSDSLSAVKRMQKMGLTVVMLTGDSYKTAQVIASKLGITDVVADVLPDGKAAQIKQLQQQGNRVAMVGDGINDAPALALAEVGIAMGSGTDVAIESAQFTLMRHSLHGVVDALELSKATLRNMKENLFGAFIYNSLGIPVAAGVLYPLTGALLSPVIAGAAMALSSITVVTNANRLRLFKPSYQAKSAQEK
ncbi:cadmium-translocating P-type ATPase [Photobacterium angustum]|uniref:Copper-exporting P-type ATPase n=1 Tax=Photobacterium angustum TaxID=661 RepID=A0A855SIP0_PHOAN|nr:copper-translocating P-type ATPase [Photobacterium angustum]KJG27177.1 copper-transporting ATPase [Photobacterium angustum]KJG51174.1 copper-transporting ATPase [Photobacterium angustum]PSW90523.1 cadmium-translocating P-type ATPase [Photobacterium angustum]PSX09241.1 cadmium-translocating P-type ATPase [Photobacterium angustum]PSX16001.1 cadmium-translocating P-type ATPase [Photobacterium angustum]